MPENHYKLRIAFTEFVRGEARSYKHDVNVEATSESDAIKDAIDRFDALARESQVGWIRRIDAVEVWRPDVPPTRDNPTARRDKPRSESERFEH